VPRAPEWGAAAPGRPAGIGTFDAGCCDTRSVEDARSGEGAGPVPAGDMPIGLIREAAARIRGRVHRTPVLSSRTAAQVVRAAQGVTLSAGPAADGQPRVFLKAEHLQLTGSFKPRGATNRTDQLTEDERRRGLIALSAGNHGQAVAYVAASQGIPVTVVMPAGASQAKVAAARRYGAEVVLHGEHVGEAFRHLERLREARGLVYVHPFDDPAIIAGQGTVGLEIVEDLPQVDVIVVGVGGGGLATGIAAAARQMRSGVRVFGVEPVASNALTLALAAGRVVDLHPVSIADGLGAPFAGPRVMALARRYLDGIVLVEEREIAAGVRFALERMKQLLEPAGAAALGAVICGRIPLRDGDTVCVVGSGGNVDLARLPGILALASDVSWP
jgi:threonine dehydratase